MLIKQSAEHITALILKCGTGVETGRGLESEYPVGKHDRSENQTTIRSNGRTTRATRITAATASNNGMLRNQRPIHHTPWKDTARALSGMIALTGMIGSRGWAGHPEVRGPRVPSPRGRFPLWRRQAIRDQTDQRGPTGPETCRSITRSDFQGFCRPRHPEMVTEIEDGEFRDEDNNSFLRRFF